jgi:HAE1 family hydrophobic/amphiphilic exporter-1
VVALRGGRPVYLRDVAKVEDSYKEIDSVVRINKRNAVVLLVRKQPTANTVAVANGVKREIDRINQDHREVKIQALRDNSRYINNAIRNVSIAAFWGGTLAIFVLLFFLQNVRSAFVIATAVPISVVATFALMYFQGFTVNIMSFGGLALGIGLLLDNSIVVLENIFRHRERGAEKREAVLKGTREVAGAITASTLTTLAVFLPLLFVPGTAGILFKQLAWVVFFSLAASLIVALTIVPVMTYQLLGAPPRDRRGGFLGKVFDLGKKSLSGMDEGYQAILRWALARRAVVIFAAFALLALSLTLSPSIGREFMPQADEGEVRIVAEMEEGANIEKMDEAFRKLETVVDGNVAETHDSFTHLGRFGWRARGKNKGHVHVWFGPRNTRQRSDKEIASSLRQKVQSVPGVVARVRSRSGLFVFRRLGLTEDDNVEVILRGHDMIAGQLLARQVKEKMEQVEGIVGVRINRQGGQPEMGLQIDREKAANLGIPVSTIARVVETSLGGTSATLYREGGDEFNILVRLADRDRRGLDTILDLTVPTGSGKPVPLKNLVRLEEGRGTMEIHRLNQERIITVSGEVSGRDMGGAIKDLQAALKELKLPTDFSILFGGDYQEQREAFRELQLGLFLALILVFVVMAAQFESFLDPLIIMFSVPFATIGILLALVLTGTTLNVNSYIGIIMLAGIVVNNAIVLVAYINLKVREDGLSVQEAVLHGGRTRLRPILMTTLTTVLAMIPLAAGLSEGSEVQAPLARVVIGGLTTSALITLVIIPVLYATVKEWQEIGIRQWRFNRWIPANGRIFRK